MLKVAKFGGSSVAEAAQFKKVKGIIDSDPSRRIVVVSAAGKRSSEDHKLTDLLYLCHAHLTYGVPCDSILQLIQDRFVEIRDDLGLAYDVEGDFAALRANLSRDTSVDELVSRGEYFTARLMAEYLGYEFIDATECIFFSYNGQFDLEKTYAAIRKAASQGRGIVIPGFYGSVPTGKIKVMSRGGSDVSGALAAAAVDADVYENWTDVSGILMADPRIVENPAPIECITYDELRELAFMGASVLHEDSIHPVREKGIALNIRNTNAPQEAGTMIVADLEQADKEQTRFITGISGRRNFSVLTMKKTNMNTNVCLQQCLKILEKCNVPAEHITLGLDTFALVAATSVLSDRLFEVMGEIQRICEPESLRLEESMALVALVGRKMTCRPGTAGKVFQCLGNHGINIRTINQSADEISITVGVDNKDYEAAIRLLYDEFAG